MLEEIKGLFKDGDYKGKVEFLVLGPWCGEFSYETNWWIPECRLQVDKYSSDDDKKMIVVVVGELGSQPLYRDFCDYYIPIPHNFGDEHGKEIKIPEMRDTWARRSDNENVMMAEIPKPIQDFYNHICDKCGEYGDVYKYSPSEYIKDKRYMERPAGIIEYYTPPLKELNIVKDMIQNHIHKKERKPLISIFAKQRYRQGELDFESWSPKLWEEFMIRLDEFGVNILNFVIEGSAGFLELDEEVVKKYPHINQMIVKNDVPAPLIDCMSEKTILGYQMAVLELTDMSIWGSTGACTLNYFMKYRKPMFVQHNKNDVWRQQFEWMRDITQDLHQIHFFDKYKRNEMENIPVDEMIDEFKEWLKSDFKYVSNEEFIKKVEKE